MMNWKTLALCCAFGGLVVGCGSETDDPAMMAQLCESETCESHFFVANLVKVGQADPATPTIVPGFNLDGLVSTLDDPEGCFHEDFTSPPPESTPGIDNQLGPIAMALAGTLDLDDAIRGNIEEGSLLILMKVEDIDDPMNDPRVTASLYLGALECGEPTAECAPVVDNGSGRLEAGQTFNIDSRSLGSGGEPVVLAEGAIVNGRLDVGPIPLDLSITLEGTTVTLNVEDAQIEADLASDGASLSGGVIGGALDIDETVASLSAAIPELPEELVRSVLTGQADLLPDEAGDCQSVSVGLVFGATTAVEGTVVTP